MTKYSDTIDGHLLVVESSTWTDHWYVEVDGIKKASGFQFVSDRPITLQVGKHQVVIRISGFVTKHIEVSVDGQLKHFV